MTETRPAVRSTAHGAASAVRSYFQRFGLIDGLWTITASVGSKVQTLALIAVAGRLGGVQDTGAVILFTSVAVLAATVVDLGLSPQVLRSFASGDLADRHAVVGPLVRRLVLHVPLVAAAAVLLGAPLVPKGTLVLWCIATIVYAMGFHASQVMTHLAYGAFRFRSGALLNGAVRTATLPLMVLVLLLGVSSALLVLILGVGELVIAVLQYKKVHLTTRGDVGTGRLLALESTWRFGLASIANAVANRSDTVAVSTVGSPSVIGLYGLSSQIENSLTTAALVPAGALSSHTARQTDGPSGIRLSVHVASIVAALYCLAAIPVFIFTGPLTSLLFGFDVVDPWPIRVCLIAGIFSCVAGVGTGRLIGLGAQRAFAVTMGVPALVGVAGLIVGALTLGAIGASLGALVRDVLFCTLAWGGTLRSLRGVR